MENKTISTITPTKPNMQGFIVAKELGVGNVQYNCLIAGPVFGPEPWYRLLEILDNAQEGDVVNLDFYTPGGWVATGCLIANAILNTKAKVVGTAMSLTASIGAMMLCACHEIKIAPMATVMFHCSSGGGFGKTPDVEDRAVQMNAYFKELMYKVGTRLLTTDEIDHLFSSRTDVFKSADELNERLKAATADVPDTTEEDKLTPLEIVEKANGDPNFPDTETEGDTTDV